MKKVLFVFVVLMTPALALAQKTVTVPATTTAAQNAEINFKGSTVIAALTTFASLTGRTLHVDTVVADAPFDGRLDIHDGGVSLNQALAPYGLRSEFRGNELHVLPLYAPTGNIPKPPNPEDADPYWQCRKASVTSQDILNCNQWDLMAHNPPPNYGSPITYSGLYNGGYGYGYGYYNPVPIIRSLRKFSVEQRYGAFRISGDLPKGGTRYVKVCVDGEFRDEATNIRNWNHPSAALSAGKHTIELRDLERMRAFKEEVSVEPKAVTETFAGKRFKINLDLKRIEGQDSYPIVGSCPGPTNPEG